MYNDPFREIGEFEFDFKSDYQVSTERERNISVSTYTYHAQAADITVEPQASYTRGGGAAVTLNGEDGVVWIARFDPIGNLESETIISAAGRAVWSW